MTGSLTFDLISKSKYKDTRSMPSRSETKPHYSVAATVLLASPVPALLKASTRNSNRFPRSCFVIEVSRSVVAPISSHFMALPQIEWVMLA